VNHHLDTNMVDQTLAQAIALHQAGKLEEAGERYLAILQAHPEHPEANHKMGILAVQMQQPVAGLPYFIAALNANPWPLPKSEETFFYRKNLALAEDPVVLHITKCCDGGIAAACACERLCQVRLFRQSVQDE